MIRLMADYECYPLWDQHGNIDPFANALLAWAEEYTGTLDRSKPPASGFVDVPAAERWLRKGAGLAAQLRDQAYPVEYFHDRERPAASLACLERPNAESHGHQRKAFLVKRLVGASSVVRPCIA